MALVVCADGEKHFLDRATGRYTLAISWSLRLFKNDVVPSEASVVSTFTIADFTGYSSSTATGWGAPTMSGGKAVSLGLLRTFVVGTPVVTTNNIYGYYIVESNTGLLIYAERFDPAPIAMNILGDTITITPRLTLASEA